MKYANKINAKYTIVIGEDELQRNSAMLKSMETGEETEIQITNIINEIRTRI